MSDSCNAFSFAAIRKKVDDELGFRKICDEYNEFSTGRTVLHHAAGIGHFDICKFLIEDVQVHIDASTYKSSLPSYIHAILSQFDLRIVMFDLRIEY